MASVSVSLLSALDTNLNMHMHIHKQLGENNNPEYGWSDDLREKIVQYYSQLNETASNDEFQMEKLRSIYRDLIQRGLSLDIQNGTFSETGIKSRTPNHMSGGMVTPISKTGGMVTPISKTGINSETGGMGVMTPIGKLIANTRDIIAGKGIYGLTYMMIAEWACEGHRRSLLGDDETCEFCNRFVANALRGLVISLDGSHPLGSWKDIKYFCNYWKKVTPYVSVVRDPIFQYAFDLVCNQLRHDSETPVLSKRSLVAKWIPREKSKKFGWITKELAQHYFKNKEPNSLEWRRNPGPPFRKLVASINKTLDTTQIKQCQNEWSKIDFDKGVTSITMRKQSYAFQNKTKKGMGRLHSTEEKTDDRGRCAEHYSSYVTSCADKNSSVKAKGKNVSMVDFVKSAIEFGYTYGNDNEIEKMIINAQWENSCENTGVLENMIAMVDTSGSMETDGCRPLYSAIGLGLRVAEKSTFGKRIMTFSNSPEWVNLDDCDNFVDRVLRVRKAPWGMNTNFHAALDMILGAAIKNEIPPAKMEGLTLAIFSDMQIDQAINGSDTDTMFEMIRKKYNVAGMQSKFATPYPVPHILFWNLRTGNGFPNLSSNANTSMLSGSSANSLNLFTNKGINGLKDITPWSIMMESLNNTRYRGYDPIGGMTPEPPIGMS